MYLRKILKKSGENVAIVVRHTTEERLLTKCFRGTNLPLAGNFQRWSSSEELFNDRKVLEQLMTELDEIWIEQEFGTHSVTIIYPTPVGWESTDDAKKYTDDVLEDFNLNRKSWGKRIHLSRRDLLAPKTSELTVIFEFKSEGDTVVAIIHSMYPGKDVGELNGDVSKREGRVFFDFNHPGAP